MRSLTLLTMLMAVTVRAEPPSIRFSSTLRSESGSTGLSATNAANVSSHTSSIDLSTGSYLKKATLRAGFDQTSPDYGRYLVTDKQGSIQAISQDYSKPENSARTGMDLYFGNISFYLDASKTVSATPFPGYSGKLQGHLESPRKGSKYNLGFQRLDYSAPTSYFVAPDTFQTRRRPTRNLENRVIGAWEQILSERMKGKIELILAERPESRPVREGTEITLGYSLTNTSGIIGKVGGARERHTEVFDDRGYLYATWGQLEFRVEPTYRWSLSTIAGTILETETARGNLPRQRIGTDSLGLSTRLWGKGWELGLKGLGAFSNTGYRSIQLGGEFVWLI